MNYLYSWFALKSYHNLEALEADNDSKMSMEL